MVNIERLEHLVTVMEGVKARDLAQEHKHFNWGDWIVVDNSPTIDALRDITYHCDREIEFEPTCGTSACVLGSAALDPKFRAEGLTAVFSRGGGPMITLRGTKLLGSGAGNAFFGLTSSQGDFLWYPGDTEVNDVDEAINRIKFLIENPDKEFPGCVYWDR